MFITDDNHLAFSSQSGDVVLKAFVVLSWILIPKNVTLRHSVSARLSDVTQTLIKTVKTLLSQGPWYNEVQRFQ